MVYLHYFGASGVLRCPFFGWLKHHLLVAQLFAAWPSGLVAALPLVLFGGFPNKHGQRNGWVGVPGNV